MLTRESLASDKAHHLLVDGLDRIEGSNYIVGELEAAA